MLSQAALDKVNADIAALTAERKPLERQIKALQKSVGKIDVRLAKLIEQRDKAVIEARDPNAFDWELIMSNGSGMSEARYKEMKRQIEMTGLHFGGGRWADTHQTCLSVMLRRGDSARTELMRKGVELALPHMKPNKDGYRRFAILEHTLCEHGIYALVTRGETVDSKWTLLFTRYGHTREIKTFANLRLALEYIEQHHYYDRADGKREHSDES